MKTPKISFVYAGFYNAIWKGWMKSEKIDFRKITLSKKSINKLKNYKKSIEEMWQKDENKIMNELSKTLGLKWWIENINCYLVEDCFSISNPLTISINRKQSDFIDMLIHELVHKILHIDKNFEIEKNAWSYIDRKYKNESKITRLHILVYATISHIYLKLFKKPVPERHISSLPDYRRAWQIVQKEGYQNIIREFRKRIKR